MTPKGLFDDNQRFVYFIINKNFSFTRNKEYYDDIVQQGMLGLWLACSNFDPSKGKFLTYASGYVNGYILRFLRENTRTIRPPRKILDVLSKYNSLNEEDFDKYLKEMEISDEEFSKALSLTNVVSDNRINFEGEEVSITNLVGDKNSNDFIEEDSFNDFLWRFTPIKQHIAVAGKLYGYSINEIIDLLSISHTYFYVLIQKTKKLYNAYNAGHKMEDIIGSKFLYLQENIHLYNKILINDDSFWSRKFVEFLEDSDVSKKQSAFDAFGKGYTVQQVADEFGLKLSTAKYYRSIYNSSLKGMENPESIRSQVVEDTVSKSEVPINAPSKKNTITASFDSISVSRDGDVYNFLVGGASFSMTSKEFRHLIYFFESLENFEL